tara:strand:+ start:193 stop:1326 length:1134 start_codon:yes stop_codon:yes gene_type:complete
MKNYFFKNRLENYWRNIDKNILICFFILFFLGSFFSFSSTSSLAGERLDKDYYFFFTKHFIFMIFAIILMFFVSFINIKSLRKSIFPLFLISFLILLLVPFIGYEVKGAKRWLNFYFFKIQPIELIKPFFVLAIAAILTSKRLKNLNSGYILSFLILSSIVILLVNQPDFGQSILLILTWISVLFISGFSILLTIFLFILLIIFGTALIFYFPSKFGYILSRIISFLDPSKGDSFQTQKALDAIRQGGFSGQGMGEGILKESVPEAHTDYIIAVISEEFGSIISIFIILIFLYVSFRIIKRCLNENEEDIKLSLCGLSSLLIFQTFIHIGVNTNLLPTTGMTLPFLSYGGSSLVGSAILAGVILNYTKNRISEKEYI